MSYKDAIEFYKLIKEEFPDNNDNFAEFYEYFENTCFLYLTQIKRVIIFNYRKSQSRPPLLTRARPKNKVGGPLRNFSKNNKIIYSVSQIIFDKK